MQVCRCKCVGARCIGVCTVCRRQGEGGRGPAWLPTTYNLETELEQFVTCYQVCLGLGSGFGVSVFGFGPGSGSALVWVLALGSGV